MALSVIGGLLPAAVRYAESFDDPPDVVLFAAEKAHIAGAVAKRRREFTTVRHCARQALAALGQPAAPLLPGAQGAPIWPEGVIGTMTHCDGYRAAAVAQHGEITSLGIDAEPHRPLPARIFRAVSSPGERLRLSALAERAPEVHWDRLLFSAKETVYKTWFPLTGIRLNFCDTELEFDTSSAEFHACLRAQVEERQGGVERSFRGRWMIHGDLILTAIAHTTY